MYEDNRHGEIFIKMSKEGSTLSGIMGGLALTISLGLQYGVPLKVFVDKLLNTRFEPSGITANPNIRFVSSVLDYIARWLGGRFISTNYLKLNGEQTAAAHTHAPSTVVSEAVDSSTPGPARGVLASMSADVGKGWPLGELKPTNANEGPPGCTECCILLGPNMACYSL